MNAVNTLISAVGGTGAVAALIAALIAHIKARTAVANEQAAALQRKEEVRKDHVAQGEKLDALKSAVDQFAGLAEENEQLRKDNDALRRKLERALESSATLTKLIPVELLTQVKEKK